MRRSLPSLFSRATVVVLLAGLLPAVAASVATAPPASAAGITMVSNSGSSAPSSGPTITLALTSAPQAGDLLVAYLGGCGGGWGNTPPAGWTVRTGTNTFTDPAVGYKVATSTDVSSHSYTFTEPGTCGRVEGRIEDWTGFTGTPVVDLATTAESATATSSLQFTGGTTLSGNELAVADVVIGGTTGPATTTSPPSPSYSNPSLTNLPTSPAISTGMFTGSSVLSAATSFGTFKGTWDSTYTHTSDGVVVTFRSASQWSPAEIQLPNSSAACATNCYTDQGVSVTFTPPSGSGAAAITVPAFLTTTGSAAGQIWRDRFTPTVSGTWTWQSHVTGSPADSALTTSGSLSVTAPIAGAHGFLRTVGHGFKFDDGTPYFMLGQTAYDLASEDLHNPTAAHTQIAMSKASGLTKIRVLIYPFQVSVGSGATPPFTDAQTSHAVLNQRYFAALDDVVQYSQSQGMQLDLEFFQDDGTPFWCNGSNCAPGINATDDRYVKYALARYAGMANVEWQLTNEFQFTPYPTATAGGYWDHIGTLVASSADPYNTSTTIVGARRPVSIHSTTNPSSGRGDGGKVLFDPATFPWETSTAFQMHDHISDVEPGRPSDANVAYQEDNFNAWPVVINQQFNLPYVTDESQYLGGNADDVGRQPAPDKSTHALNVPPLADLPPGATIPSATDDTVIRWGIWGAAASGGYATIGDATKAPASTWDPNSDAIAVTGDWMNGSDQGTMYTATLRLKNFFASLNNPTLLLDVADTGLKTGPSDSAQTPRQYASSTADKSLYVAYSAVPAAITLNLPAGSTYNVTTYNVLTGVPTPSSQPVTGGSLVTIPKPTDVGTVGDWAMFATRTSTTGITRSGTSGPLNGSNATTLPLPLSAAPKVGDLLVAYLGGCGGGWATSGSGWTIVTTPGVHTDPAIAYKVAVSADVTTHSYAFTENSGGCGLQGVIEDWTGFATSPVVDISKAAEAGTASSLPFSAGTTVTANELAVANIDVGGTGGVPSPVFSSPALPIADDSPPTSQMFTGFQVLTATTSFANFKASWASNYTHSSDGLLMTFKAS
jgi:hypothetical protein